MPKLYKAGAIPEMGNMYLLFGAGGTGKTSIIKQFEGNKLVFSFDGSTNAIRDTDDVTVWAYDETDAPTIQSDVSNRLTSSLFKINKDGARELRNNFDVVVLDNITALANWTLDNIEDASKDGRQNYNKLQSWFRNLAMFLRGTGLTVYATAHELNNSSSGVLGKGQYPPDMNDKTFNAFMAPFDVVGRIYKQDGKSWIDVDPENGNRGKNRLDDRKLFLADEFITYKKEEKED